jgi:hypothetical protein
MGIRHTVAMMRSLAGILCFALTLSAHGQQPEQEPVPQPAADYSRDTLIEIFANVPEREEDADAKFRHRFGAIDFRALGIRWRVGYLPFLMPLAGSMPWVNGQRWPDPFALTRTEIPMTPRTWRDRRAMNAELRRIERLTKEEAQIKVQPE